MSRIGRSIVAVFAVLLSVPGLCRAESAADDAAIRAVVGSYQLALNKSDADAVASLFTDDAVVMLQKSPTVTGKQSVRDFYRDLFKTLGFDLNFGIAEIVQVSPDWAFVRTASTGTVKIVSNGGSAATTGQELFILRKENSWRIARYAGSSTR